MNKESNRPDSKEPWYRTPFMWLIVAVPVISLVTGSLMLVFALQAPDRMVALPHTSNFQHVVPADARDDKKSTKE